MDKKTECENIAELFSEKYSELYNSVSYETDQLATITNNNMKDITMYCMINARTCNDSDNIVHTHYVTHDQVQCAINQGWGQVQLTKYSSTPSTPNIYQVQVLVKYSFKKKNT